MRTTTPDARSRPAAMPPTIRRVLGQVGRRLRVAVLLRGVGWVALAVAIGVMVGMVADFAAALPRWVRWMIWGTWLATAVALLAVQVLRPLWRRADALDLAALAERTHPGLGERLTGAVALLGTHSTAHRHGSPTLIAALVDEAAARVATVDPARVVPLRRPARGFAVGLVALGLAAAPAIVWPATCGLLARRSLAPWSDLDQVGRYVLTVTPGDHVAAIGSDLTVSARIRPRFGDQAPPKTARLEWARDGEDIWHSLDMVGLHNSKESEYLESFAKIIPRLSGSLSYRVVSGPVASRSYRITAIEPPAVSEIAVKVEPPAYTGFPTATVHDPRRIEAWEGSRVTLEIAANRPVRAIEVEWPIGAEPTEETGRAASALHIAATLDDGGKRGTATVETEATGTYSVMLRDQHNLINRPESPRRVIVRRDEAPVVVVEGTDAVGTEVEEASPNDVLTAGVEARDDIAVASIELHYEINRAGDIYGKDHVSVRAAGLGTRAARGEARLGLRSLGLKPGDRLSYRVRVADNRPAPRGPNVTWSPARSLTIVANAEPLEARRSRAGRERWQAKLDALKAAAATNRRETEQLRVAADAASRGDGRWDEDRQQALNRREAEARDVADRLQLLARELAEDDLFHPLAPPARQIAENEAEAGRALLERALRDSDPARRLDYLRQADRPLADVVHRLDDLQRAFDALARRDAGRQQLRDLASREEAIADRAREPSADRDQFDRLKNEQTALQDDLDSLLRSTPELAEETPGATDASASRPLDSAREAMKQAVQQLDQARDAAQDQEPTRSSDAAQAAQGAMQQAARDLRTAASQGTGTPDPSKPDRPQEPASGESQETLAGSGTVDLTRLKAMIARQTGRTWGELPGHLRTEILQMSQEHYRDDYARLIQLYFREIAAGAGRPDR